MHQGQQRVAQALSDRYAVEGEVGRGGMAIVYLAKDLRHDRRVAIKVLAPDIGRALGAERFLREIGIAARLSHPRIVPLLDSGRVDELLFYVMPFIEGESLRERLDREQQLPMEDAIDIAREVAAALSFAHSHGVVHRDIKPENILLSSGEAMVADFGIARAVSEAGGTRLTATGLAVGTPAYMSPEQASGSPTLDARADIYALGCVLYEMLAGEPPFSGPTAQAITARKLSESAPNVAVVRDAVPPAVVDAVAKALARVPADRPATARQFADALRPSHWGSATQAGQRPQKASTLGTRARGIATGAAVSLLGVLALWGWLRPTSHGAVPPVRMSALLPPGVSATGGPGFEASSVALSPDGRTLVIAGTGDDDQRLYLRALDRLEATPLAGTEGGSSPFFSPDGEWIGFYAAGRLMRVPSGGGGAVLITEVPGSGYPAGASWGPDDQIVFAFGGRSPLHIVSADGGTSRPIAQIDVEAGEMSHEHPAVLPGGRAVLFQARGWIHVLNWETGERSALVQGRAPQFASSGHIILNRGGTLWTAPFDPSRMQVTGPVRQWVEGISGEKRITQHYTVSGNGTLAYVPSGAVHTLTIREPDGSERFVTEERLVFQNPQFSPDGRRLAVATQRSGGPLDLWIHDLESGSASRLTFNGGRAPIWTPDGAGVTFSHLGPQPGIYTKPWDGRTDAQQLIAINEFHWLVGWTPDGNTLAFGMMDGVQEDGTSPSSIVAYSGGVQRLVVGPGDSWGGRLSPDGRWLAYYSRESGQFEVYVVPFPEAGARWQISEGGRDPSWSPDGSEVYYLSGDRLMAARLDIGTGVRVTSRRLVLQPYSSPLYDDYDIHPRNGTLALVRPIGDRHGNEVVIVINWAAELQREHSN